MSIAPRIDLHVSQSLFGVRAGGVQLGHAIDHVDRKCEAIDFIFDRKLYRGVDVAAFLISTDMQILMIITVVCQPVNQPWITVEIEDDRFVRGEETVEVAITQAMRMLAICLHLE